MQPAAKFLPFVKFQPSYSVYTSFHTKNEREYHKIIFFPCDQSMYESLQPKDYLKKPDLVQKCKQIAENFGCISKHPCLVTLCNQSLRSVPSYLVQNSQLSPPLGVRLN